MRLYVDVAATIEGLLFTVAGALFYCHRTWQGIAGAVVLAILANLVRRASTRCAGR